MSSFAGANADESTKEREIILISGDSEEFRVPVKVASMSNVINNILGEEDQDEEKRVPLPNVNKENLAKVLEFCNHYQEEPMTEIVKPLQDADLTRLIQPFYATFIMNLDNERLAYLTLAANYLDIKPLLDLCCARITSYIKNKTPEEIRQNLGIVVDMTPEEEAQIREENKWIDDA